MRKQKPPSLPETTPPALPPVLGLGRSESERIVHAPPAPHVAQVIIAQVCREQVEQIRLTPQGNSTTVDYQANGIWKETMCVPHTDVPGLFAAFKALAGLPDWEHRMALQGLIAVRHEGVDYNILIFVKPTRHGETILMTIEAVSAPPEQTPE